MRNRYSEIEDVNNGYININYSRKDDGWILRLGDDDQILLFNSQIDPVINALTILKERMKIKENE